jgi:3-ketosteroid 9alpha-monooxygenase subunit A
MKNFPYTTFPTGWFQIGWSAELAVGEVKPIRLFDEDLVLYRTESGAARLVDSQCPHLGAHLGYGGIVKGDCIACPFHGWEFGLDGRNQHIPFLNRSNPAVSLKQWLLEEVDGFLIVWHDALDRAPLWTWSSPEFGDRDNFYEPSRHYAGVRKILPHQPIENGPDALHFPFVHGSGEPAEIVVWDDSTHRLIVEFDLKLGVGKESTELTPEGPTTTRLRSVGTMSLGYVSFTLNDIYVPQLVCVTPVDHENSMVFSTTTGRRDPSSEEPSGAIKAMMEIQHPLVERDFNIWEHQVFNSRPPYAGHEEKYFPRFRRWLEQFYPAEVPPRD